MQQWSFIKETPATKPHSQHGSRRKEMDLSSEVFRPHSACGRRRRRHEAPLRPSPTRERPTDRTSTLDDRVCPVSGHPRPSSSHAKRKFRYEEGLIAATRADPCISHPDAFSPHRFQSAPMSQETSGADNFLRLEFKRYGRVPDD